ncbi:GNAT family N-acetyltransferase [Paenibacillus sp. PK3_47]|uniref:GNAT family N-acetyltransferase n=1 Tax=Paenibacillus sp. PK3_47 TaxID=2072642 RepID=UPI00201D8059|nr:GNAT family N-acetyltransferase [Paenibacillus sp. PK3_47]
MQNKAENGPPGYDSIDWQTEMMQKSHYYKLMADGILIGGVIVFLSADKREGYVGRIFIDPLFQNRGYGQEVFRFLFTGYPTARKWGLDTPSWAARNQYFYKKLGFVQTREITDSASGDAFYEYELIFPE